MLQDSDTQEMINKCLNCIRSECINCLDYKLRSVNGQHNRPEFEYEKIERLYKSGLTDLEIANRINCHRHTVYRWRTRNDLVANVKPRSI